MSNFEYIKNVAQLNYDSDLCIGCGMCAVVCPHRVFKMDGKVAAITNKDKCMECGACALNCISNAIKVEKGVGCAAAVLYSYFNNGEVACGCDAGCCD